MWRARAATDKNGLCKADKIKLKWIDSATRKDASLMGSRWMRCNGQAQTGTCKLEVTCGKKRAQVTGMQRHGSACFVRMRAWPGDGRLDAGSKQRSDAAAGREMRSGQGRCGRAARRRQGRTRGLVELARGDVRWLAAERRISSGLDWLVEMGVAGCWARPAGPSGAACWSASLLPGGGQRERSGTMGSGWCRVETHWRLLLLALKRSS
jgi:hypothetical protein